MNHAKSAAMLDRVRGGQRMKAGAGMRRGILNHGIPEHAENAVFE